jgi:hypothetical protein
MFPLNFLPSLPVPNAILKFGIESALKKLLEKNLTNIGTLETLETTPDSLTLTLALLGEPQSVQLELRGIRWAESDENGEHLFHLYFTEIRASKPWMQGVFERVADHTNRRLSFPVDGLAGLALQPAKAYFIKATS